ncbi:MAG: c-type cytochrome [Candidatus Acidiferrales bacterium]
MSSRRHKVILIVAIITAALVLFLGVLAWQWRGSPEQWNSFLVGDPRAGAQTFQQKGCSSCHSVLGVGAKLAPDLGLKGAAGSTMNELVTQMWNHAPRMWEQIKLNKISFPQFTPEEMANLFAYLYVTCYDDESGDPTHGKLLFTQKGCIRCHATGDTGGSVGPNLKEIGPVDTPIFWSQTMWNHAPVMEIYMSQFKMAWPRFEGEQMNDLLAFMRSLRGGPERESDLLPANPHRGWAVFRAKGCISCHAIHGEGGTVGPDLGSDRPLPRTLTQLAGRMWNHSPEMWAAMKAKGIERPAFEGQEMSDLISFLYSVRYFDLGGSPIIGQELFNERKCSQCHGSDARGGKMGPNLRKAGQVLTPVDFALALWSHGPRMYPKAEELGLGWPTLNEGDLSHLLTFLNSPPVKDQR